MSESDPTLIDPRPGALIDPADDFSASRFAAAIHVMRTGQTVEVPLIGTVSPENVGEILSESIIIQTIEQAEAELRARVKNAQERITGLGALLKELYPPKEDPKEIKVKALQADASYFQ